MNTINVEHEHADMDKALTSLFHQTDGTKTSSITINTTNHGSIEQSIIEYNQVKKQKNACDKWIELVSIISYPLPLALFGYIKIMLNIWPANDWVVAGIATFILALLIPIASFLGAVPLAILEVTFPEKWAGKLLRKIIPSFKRKEDNYLRIKNELYAKVRNQEFQYAYLAYLKVQIKQIKDLQHKWSKESVLNQKKIAKSGHMLDFLENNHARLVTLLSEEEDYEESFLRSIKNIDECLRENAQSLQESDRANQRQSFITGYQDFLAKHGIEDVMSKSRVNQKNDEVESQAQLDAGLKKHL